MTPYKVSEMINPRMIVPCGRNRTINVNDNETGQNDISLSEVYSSQTDTHKAHAEKRRPLLVYKALTQHKAWRKYSVKRRTHLVRRLLPDTQSPFTAFANRLFRISNADLQILDDANYMYV